MTPLLLAALLWQTPEQLAAAREMSPFAWAFMLVSMGAVTALAAWSFGRVLKGATWVKLVEAVIEESGGTAPDGVETDSEALEDAQAKEIERWVEDLVMTRRRETGAEV